MATGRPGVEHGGADHPPPPPVPFFQVEGGISKEALLEIYAEVLDGTFKVFAPVGLPRLFWRYCPKALLLDRYSGGFEQALDVVSEAVYASKGLSETAVAIAVHQFVEIEADERVRESIKAMQGALLQLVDPPVVISLPRVVSKEEFLHVLRRYLEVISGVVDGGERGPPLVAKERKEWLKGLYYAIRGMGKDPVTGSDLGYEALQALAGLYENDAEVRALMHQITTRSALGDDFYWSAMAMIQYDKEVEAVWTPPVLARFCRFCDAVEEGMEMVAMGNVEEARHELGCALRRAGEDDDDDDDEEEEAEEEEEEEEALLEELRRRLPPSAIARVYSARASCFMASGETEAAMMDLTTALEKDVRCSTAYQARGGLYKEQGKVEEAVEDYCRAFVLEGLKSATEVQQLEAALKASYRDEAVALLQTRPCQRELPADWLIRSYFRSFRAEGKDGSIRKSVERRGTDGVEGEAALRKAMMMRWEGDYQGAFETLEKEVLGAAFQFEDMKALGANQWGSFLYLTGDLVGAEAVLRESLEVDPSSCNTRLKLGEVLCDMGRIEDGLILLDEAVSLYPSDTDALLHRGQSLLTHDDLVQAVLDLRQSLAMYNGVPIGWACLGTALFKLEEGSEEAQQVLEDAVAKYSDNLEVSLYYGDVVAQKGDLVGAMKRFQHAAEIEPLCPLPYVNAARAYMTVRDLVLAEQHLREAIRIDPKCSSCYLDMGQLYVQSGDLEAAMAQFDMAMKYSRYLPEIQDALVFRKLAQIQAEKSLPLQQAAEAYPPPPPPPPAAATIPGV